MCAKLRLASPFLEGQVWDIDVNATINPINLYVSILSVGEAHIDTAIDAFDSQATTIKT